MAMAIDRNDWLIISGVSAAFVVTLWASGWTTPWINPDTASYLIVAPYPQFYFQPRLPFYGWLVAALGGESSFRLVVWFQLALHILAAMMLYVSVRRLDAGKAAAMALFLAALLSQAFLIFGDSIAPETLAVSLTLVAMSATLLVASAVHWKRYLLLAAMAGVAACLLRPIFLPLIVMLPVLLVLAARITARAIVPLRVVVLLLASLLPLLAYMADRARHTGDFRLVAYGGFTISGMAGLMLSQDIVERSPAPDREFAGRVLAARQQAEAAGRVLRTPVNSKGERSFLSAAAGYFDIYARTYEDLLTEITKLRSADEAWAEFDRRLQRFAVTTIILAPERYAAWVAGASSRLVGRVIVTNAPFMLASFALLVALLSTLRGPGRIRNLTGSTDVLLVVAIVAVYVLCAAPLAVLITYPTSRYIDTAAVLLPALPLLGAIRLVSAVSAKSAA
jgi:hypothetical protein